MVTIKCDGCKREVEVTEDWDRSADCKECGGYFSELDSDEEISCTCNECGEDFDSEELINFEEADISICKDCIDSEYPRETKIVERIIEVPVEKKVFLEANIKQENSLIDFDLPSKFD